MASFRSMTSSEENHAHGSGPKFPWLLDASQPANTASTPLRTSVGQPTGAECSWPKQWQSGLRPRIIAMPTAIIKTVSNASAPRAPYQASLAGISAAATASSITGRSNTMGRANAAWQAKIAQGLAESQRVDQFGSAREKKDRGQQEPGSQQSKFHDSQHVGT